MVLLHVKGKDKADQFIVQHTVNDSVDDATENIINLWNLRLRVRAVGESCKLMAKFGPLRPEAERGITDANIFKESFPDSSTNPLIDPDGQRMGHPPVEAAAETLVKTADEALAAISETHAERRQPLELMKIEEHLKLLDGALTICYPEGLPEWDITSQILNGEVDAPHWDQKRVYNPEEAQLWFCNKKLMRGEVLSKYVGTNEKTKVVIKITKNSGSHQPVREPAVDEESRKRMMAFWHKKQETEKKLQADDDDSYLTSQWADPQTLKRAFCGTSNGIRFR